MDAMLSRLLWPAHVAATLFMAGVIWFVQLVHYPIMTQIPPGAFPAYQAANMTATAWLVTIPMGVEALTALLLLWRRPEHVPANVLRVGLVLVVLIWLSTWLIQYPRHEALRAGFDSVLHRSLLDSNWLRTAGWTARGVLVVWILAGRPSRRFPSEASPRR